MRWVAPLMVAFTLSAATVGSAQSVRYTPPPPPDPLSVEIMSHYAQCVVDRNPSKARALLAANYHTEAYRKELRSFARDQHGCLPNGKLRFAQLIFAGDMAEALMQHDHVSSDAIVAAASADRAPGTMRCIVQKEPNEVVALLATRPASFDEHGAIGNLVPTLAACTARGETTVANPVGFRASMALATYNMLNDQPPLPAGNP